MKFNLSLNSNPLCTIESSPISQRGALILKDYLDRITSASFEINPATPMAHSICFTTDTVCSIHGFSYVIENKNLIFRAQNEQNFVYAVYDFLERVIGCRYYTPTTEYIPKSSTLTVTLKPHHADPLIEYREIYYQNFEDKTFAEKHKAAQSKTHEGWGFWCHSFQLLLPHETYFKEHPEYFALMDGKRHPQGEPCLSNPKVRELILTNLKKFMDEKPECRYWSVSQNDDNHYCQCEACKKIDDYDESPMGSILNFVNFIASQFPDKVISTLSYWYTRKPPKHTRPADNVHIMTCNIEAGRGLPIATDPSCKESKEELEFWASISNNVSLWDYNIQFRNLVSPFPNLRTLAPNMQFFAENKVKLLFSQCNREIGGEFHELRGYLLAKLAWDPYCDIEFHMQDFCNGYYKEAGPFILKYIELLHDAQESSNHRLDIFGGPQDAKETYLTESLVQRYDELFLLAREAVSYDQDLLLRVQTAQLSLDYAALVLKYDSRDKRLNRLMAFAKTARATGLHKVEEWKITVDQFVTDTLVEI